jgi:hypothetical protein
MTEIARGLPSWQPCMANSSNLFAKGRCAYKDTPPIWSSNGSIACRGRRGLIRFSVLGEPKLENMLLTQCASPLLPEYAQPGDAMLTRSLLAGATPQPRSRYLDAIVAKLERNETVRLLAVGMSVTAMFARACEHSPEKPFLGTSTKSTNWLARLVATLARRYPGATVKAATHAAGGMSALSLTHCPGDSLCATRLGGCPDLMILDFALGLGFPSTIKARRPPA